MACMQQVYYQYVSIAHTYIENCRQPLRLFRPDWGSSVQCTQSLHTLTCQIECPRELAHVKGILYTLTITLVNTTYAGIRRQMHVKCWFGSCWQIFEEWRLLEKPFVSPWVCIYTQIQGCYSQLLMILRTVWHMCDSPFRVLLDCRNRIDKNEWIMTLLDIHVCTWLHATIQGHRHYANPGVHNRAWLCTSCILQNMSGDNVHHHSCHIWRLSELSSAPCLQNAPIDCSSP